MVIQAYSPRTAVCRAEDPSGVSTYTGAALQVEWRSPLLLLGRCLLRVVLSQILGAGRHVAPQWLHPRLSQGSCSPGVAGATTFPPALPVFQQLAQGCFHLLGCLYQTLCFPCCPWRSSVLCAAAARCDGHRKDSLAAGLQAARPHLGTPGWLPLHCPRRHVAASLLLPAPACPWIHPSLPGSCPCRTTIR